MELLPRGALDDAEPDGRRLEGSTGNTGPTLEFIYRLAALVIWPREKTVDIVASGSIDRAVSWVEMQCAAVGRGGEGAGDSGSADKGASARIRRLLGRLTDLWPVGKDAYQKQDRAAMLRLLHGAGEADVAVDFLHRVVMANYDGAENETLAAILPVIGTGEAAEFLPWFVEEHLPRRFRDVVEVLVLADTECAGGRRARRVVDPALDAAWREVLREAVATALSGLDAALRTESETRPGQDDDWPLGTRRRLPAPSASAPDDKWIDQAAVCGLVALANRLGLDDEAAAAAENIGEYPDIVTPDRMLPAALELMRKLGKLGDAPAYGVLWRQAADFLLERSSTVPVEPDDWTITADIPCKCELCDKLRAFCEDPVRRLEHFKVRKDLRKHLHQVIDRHRLDLHHVTKRQGRPYTLVCTKNRSSHERRLDEYAGDLRRMDSLLAGAPDRERRGTPEGRVVRLARAMSVAGSTRDAAGEVGTRGG